MTGQVRCRVTVQHDRARQGASRGCRAFCHACLWSGPWVRYASTAERHRQAHLYVGAHRA